MIAMHPQCPYQFASYKDLKYRLLPNPAYLCMPTSRFNSLKGYARLHIRDQRYTDEWIVSNPHPPSKL